MAYVDDIIIGSHPLGLALKAARAASGLGLDDLTVLSHKYDPFRFDTPERHHDAAWFAELFNRLVAPGVTIHIRGFHYLLVSAGGVVKPDGTAYENTEADYTFLGTPPSAPAGWAISASTASSTSAILIRSSTAIGPTASRLMFSCASLGHAAVAALPAAASPRSAIEAVCLCDDFRRRQPYAFAFFGEKSSLEPVLTRWPRPIRPISISPPASFPIRSPGGWRATRQGTTGP